jgi:hypothetical protein
LKQGLVDSTEVPICFATAGDADGKFVCACNNNSEPVSEKETAANAKTKRFVMSRLSAKRDLSASEIGMVPGKSRDQLYFFFFNTLARVRNRSAFNRMKPVASAWLYAPWSASMVATYGL